MTNDQSKPIWVSNTGYTFVDEGRDVYTAALDRIRRLYTLSDNYIVGFSSGKDSTTVLMLSLQVARELGKLPLHVAFVDEEVIAPDCIDYAAELMSWDELQIDWFCVPMRHTLRSKKRSYWITWDETQRDKWVRDMPPWAIKADQVPGLDENTSYVEIFKSYYLKKLGYESVVFSAGIRAEESFNRRRTLIQAGDYVTNIGANYFYGRPIYDWTVQDVWRAIFSHKWPYSKHYDKLWLSGVPMTQQRVGPWGNVGGFDEAPLYAEYYPDFWEKAMKRIPELGAAGRYGKTALYNEVLNKPASMTWQEYTMKLLDEAPERDQKFLRDRIAMNLRRWARLSTAPFPETPVMIGNQQMPNSWRNLAHLVAKNDRIRGSNRDSK